MDLSFLSEIIAAFVSFIFSFFDGVDLSPIGSALEYVSKYIKAALYILPSGTIAQIFSVVCVLWSFRLVVKSIITIWNLLPIA